MKALELTGVRFGRLVCIERDSDNKKGVRWICQCDCKNIKSVLRSSLTSGRVRSCGCLRSEVTSNRLKKINEFIVDKDNDIVIIKCKHDKELIVDLDDYELVKDYYWWTNKNYGMTTHKETKKILQLHRLIMNITDKKISIDHVNRNPLDNRKENLRVVTHIQNMQNVGIKKNNSSGVIGVRKRDENDTWRAQIVYNKKTIRLGTFQTKEDAIVARLKAENKYFKEFAPQKHLFQEYGIGD